MTTITKTKPHFMLPKPFLAENMRMSSMKNDCSLLLKLCLSFSLALVLRDAMNHALVPSFPRFCHFFLQGLSRTLEQKMLSTNDNALLILYPPFTGQSTFPISLPASQSSFVPQPGARSYDRLFCMVHLPLFIFFLLSTLLSTTHRQTITTTKKKKK